MVRLTLTAARQLDQLLDHFIMRGRPEAVDRLVASLRDALARIEADPASGRSYPANYPAVARWGYRWIKVHRYWFAYSAHPGRLIVTNVLFERSDIPGRIATEDDEVDAS